MQQFYRQSLLALIALVVANAGLAAWCVSLSHPEYRLAPRGGVRWQLVPSVDREAGGTSSVQVRGNDPDALSFGLRLTKAARYPFAGVRHVAADARGAAATVDLRRYDTIVFEARCRPAAPLMLGISVFDKAVSTPGQYVTYRSPTTFFSCSEQGVPVSIDLRRLAIPNWWFHAMRLPYSPHDYGLDKVAYLSFGASPQTPYDTDNDVRISGIALRGHDDRYLNALAVVSLLAWTMFALCFFRGHARALAASLRARMRDDLPLAAYRQLTGEPCQDAQQAAILKHIATHYTNAELNLESVAADTNTNRNKVNDVLKASLGMTFTAYVNKLRLTEAARLLAETPSATVAEIAYSVGYSNVSYFNRLFKDEYGCTPGAFRAMAPGAETSPS
jgi:AraC-like DNA-binding protein